MFNKFQYTNTISKSYLYEYHEGIGHPKNFPRTQSPGQTLMPCSLPSQATTDGPASLTLNVFKISRMFLTGLIQHALLFGWLLHPGSGIGGSSHACCASQWFTCIADKGLVRWVLVCYASTLVWMGGSWHDFQLQVLANTADISMGLLALVWVWAFIL